MGTLLSGLPLPSITQGEELNGSDMNNGHETGKIHTAV